MSPISNESRIKGSLYGVAVVDALGGPVEFKQRGSFPRVTGYRHNGNFNVPPGTWTDDTSMTLCLAQALIDFKGSFVSQAAIRNYIQWWQKGYLSAVGYCFDIGGSTALALGMWKRYFEKESKISNHDPRGHLKGQEDIDKSLRGEGRCGNGSLMRVAPVGLAYSHNLNLAVTIAARSSEVTHPHRICTECCVLYTRLIVRAMNGGTKDDLARDFACSTFVNEKVKKQFRGYAAVPDWQARPAKDISSSGFVLSTLEAALWSFFTTNSFQEGALKVVNLGDDADTVGAVYGGLAGAFYGFESIPGEWIDGLQKKDVLQRISSGLISVANGKNSA